jgi:hypothetical protein
LRQAIVERRLVSCGLKIDRRAASITSIGVRKRAELGQGFRWACGSAGRKRRAARRSVAAEAGVCGIPQNEAEDAEVGLDCSGCGASAGAAAGCCLSRPWARATLEADESAGGGGEGVAGSAGRDVDIFRQEGVGGVLPQFGFDPARAAEAPFVVNESIDEETLVGVGWACDAHGIRRASSAISSADSSNMNGCSA